VSKATCEKNLLQLPPTSKALTRHEQKGGVTAASPIEETRDCILELCTCKMGKGDDSKKAFEPVEVRPK